MSWTDERVTTLKKLHLEGLSASQIARRLGGFPESPDGGRNAVLGKLNRLGLLGRAKASAPSSRPALKSPSPPRQRSTMPSRPAAPAQVQLPAPVHRIEEPGSATVLTLGSHMCKWPIGDPSSDDFTFCGRRTGEGPYCREHKQVAHREPKVRSGSRQKRHDTNHINF